ncbi:GNAT family N-acetyltransferase [Rarobacter faecitabidus]|uniref:L-amino acid N-acyltransferase YncA n=1 Tax=Rarobacter faecitabidus TaxID=13243 RepID=A0A542ZNY8_RARFA|nr:GNAT family N-acetyltransferase [Rarobacter faecitabidus]TQL62073.1 L-amino acid N-acyltransferase YncA [Rarobacter faecitabidus]
MTAPTQDRPLTGGAILRPARPGDEEGILVLIQELADYEREPDAVKNTPAMLRETLFEDDPKVFAHVIELDGEIVGTAIWFINYSTWTGRAGIYLEDFYVRPAHRGRGYGKALLRQLASICVERGYTRLNWAVLNWNQPSIDIYNAIGGHGQTDWTTYVLDGERLAVLARG